MGGTVTFLLRRSLDTWICLQKPKISGKKESNMWGGESTEYGVNHIMAQIPGMSLPGSGTAGKILALLASLRYLYLNLWGWLWGFQDVIDSELATLEAHSQW